VLPFPVIFAPYLRTQDFPPSGAALDPSLSFSQPVNLQMRIVHPGYFCGTLQPSTHFGLHSFVVFCIKSFHNSFTISRFHTLSQKCRGVGRCHLARSERLGVSPNNSHSGNSSLATSHCFQVPSAHTLTNAPSRNPFRLILLQMPGGWGGCFLFSDSSTL
jgi:hypothetical protein